MRIPVPVWAVDASGVRMREGCAENPTLSLRCEPNPQRRVAIILEGQSLQRSQHPDLLNNTPIHEGKCHAPFIKRLQGIGVKTLSVKREPMPIVLPQNRRTTPAVLVPKKLGEISLEKDVDHVLFFGGASPRSSRYAFPSATALLIFSSGGSSSSSSPPSMTKWSTRREVVDGWIPGVERLTFLPYVEVNPFVGDWVRIVVDNANDGDQ